MSLTMVDQAPEHSDASDEQPRGETEPSSAERRTLVAVEGSMEELAFRFADGSLVGHFYEDSEIQTLAGVGAAWIRDHREETVGRLQSLVGRVVPVRAAGEHFRVDAKVFAGDLEKEAETRRAGKKRPCSCGVWVGAGAPIRLHVELRLVVGCTTCQPGLDAKSIEAPSKAEIRARESELTCWGLPLDERTDAADASRFVSASGEDVKFVGDTTWKSKPWAVWDGTHWERVDNREVKRRLILFFRAIKEDALERASSSDDETDKKAWESFAQHADRRLNRVGLEAVLSLISSFHGLVVAESVFDGLSSTMLLNLRNGTIDLATGQLREHRREDWITFRLDMEYDAEAKCPRWERFQHEIFDGDQQMMSFVRRIHGYGLTASTKEEKAFVFYDAKRGGTGKSTHLDTIHALAGPYARNVEPATFDANGKETIRSDVMRLKGGRFALVNEPDRGMVLSEGMIKKLVSGDPFTGRVRYGDEFEFRPTMKFFMPTNYLPRIEGDDEAIWDRFLVVPFTQRFRGTLGQDKNLRETLLAELPGILLWAVRGAVDWRLRGLDPPPPVVEATEKYRGQQGGFRRWLAECCIVGSDEPGEQQGSRDWTPTEDLFDSYQAWSEKGGVEAHSKIDFGRRLGGVAELQPQRRYVRSSQVRGWSGLRLRSPAGERE